MTNFDKGTKPSPDHVPTDEGFYAEARLHQIGFAVRWWEVLIGLLIIGTFVSLTVFVAYNFLIGAILSLFAGLFCFLTLWIESHGLYPTRERNLWEVWIMESRPGGVFWNSELRSYQSDKRLVRVIELKYGGEKRARKVAQKLINRNKKLKRKEEARALARKGAYFRIPPP